jgi:hypothetical protein
MVSVPAGPPQQGVEIALSARALEIDSAVREYDAFLFEQAALELVRARSRRKADCASRVDDAMPWQLEARRRHLESVTDEARATWKPRAARDAAVARDLAARDSGNRFPDALEQLAVRHSHDRQF